MSVSNIKRAYYLVSFLHWLSVGLPGALTVLLMQARGISLFQVGLLTGLYSATIVLLELPTGGLADTVGRKPVTLLSFIVTLGSLTAFLFALSFPVYVLAFILMGVGRALSSGALDSWFVDSLLDHDPETDLQPPLAQADTLGTVGLTVGTLLGGVIPKLFPDLPPDGSAVFTPLAMTFVAALIVKLGATWAVAALIKEDRARFTLESGGAFSPGVLSGVLRDALELTRRSPVILLLLVGAFAGSVGLMSVETFWQPRFRELLGGEPNSLVFGVLMTVGFLLSGAGSHASIPLSKFLGRRYGLVAVLSYGVAGASVIMLALQSSALYAAPLFWLFYLSFAVRASPVATILNEEVPSNRRSSMQSVLSLAGYMGSLSGSLALGFIAQEASIKLAWVVTGCVLLVAIGAYLGVERLRASTARTSL